MHQQFEVFLSVDNEGNAAVSLENAAEAREGVAEYEGDAVRTVRLTVTMELPEVPAIDVEVPASAELVKVEAQKELEPA